MFKSIADDVKKVSTSANTSNANNTLDSRALPNKAQSLERILLHADDHLQSRKDNNINLPMHHSICPDLNTDLYKQGSIEYIDTDQNNHVTDLSDEQGEHHINSSNSDNE